MTPKPTPLVLGVPLLAIATLMVATLTLSAEPSGRFQAAIGLATRAPSKAEAASHKLELKVRYRGQVIRQVEADSPAAKAGLQIGDVVIRFDANDLYSFDDVRDFVAVSKPGQEVKVTYKRKNTTNEQSLTLKLGKRPVPKEQTNTVTWHYAGLGQLELALAQAKKQNAWLMVGISGAET